MSTGYGGDTWCADSMVTGRFARGLKGLALACYRRLITPRGSLIGGEEEENYGFDVSSYVGEVGTERALATLPGRVRGELMKDDRLASVTVDAAISTATNGDTTIVLSITIEAHDEAGDFTFTVSVTDTAAVLQLEAA